MFKSYNKYYLFIIFIKSLYFSNICTFFMAYVHAYVSALNSKPYTYNDLDYRELQTLHFGK